MGRCAARSEYVADTVYRVRQAHALERPNPVPFFGSQRSCRSSSAPKNSRCDSVSVGSRAFRREEFAPPGRRALRGARSASARICRGWCRAHGPGACQRHVPLQLGGVVEAAGLVAWRTSWSNSSPSRATCGTLRQLEGSASALTLRGGTLSASCEASALDGAERVCIDCRLFVPDGPSRPPIP